MSCPDLLEVSDYELGMSHNGLGQFIHFGIKTFNGEAGFGTAGDQNPITEWPSSDFNPTNTITTADVVEWLTPIKMCGGTYAIFTAKHVDGWCAWPTSTQTGTGGYPAAYNITGATAPHNTLDLCQMFVDACDNLGLNAMFYYGMADRNFNNTSDWRMDTATALQYMKDQCAELINDYDPYGLWFDVTSWTTGGNGNALYSYCKTLKSNIVICGNFPDSRISSDGCTSGGTVNNTDIPDGRADVFSGEESGGTIDLVPDNYGMPFETVARIYRSGAWFNHTDDQVPTETAASLNAEISQNINNGAAYCLNVSPGPNGRLSVHEAERMRELAVLRGTISNNFGVDTL